MDIPGWPPENIEGDGQEVGAGTSRLTSRQLTVTPDLIRGSGRSCLVNLRLPRGTREGRREAAFSFGPQRKIRPDIPYANSNRQLAFLQHIYLNLGVGGRAAVILPDNALFEEGIAAQIRRDLMDRCDLHTILRLPAGIFPNTNIKTSVLFFSKKGDDDVGATEVTWIYDMRSHRIHRGGA